MSSVRAATGQLGAVPDAVGREPAADGLAGRVVIVTGGSRGIGRAVAERLAVAGAQVVVAARDGDRAEQVAGSLGSESFGIGIDLSASDSAQALVEQTVARAGRLDGLVNNAGVSLVEPSLASQRADWQRVIDLNLTGSFFAAQAAAAAFADGGAIVNLASIAALTGLPGRAAYAASKGAIVALTRVLAVEWSPRVRVNAIAPGYIRTDAMDTLIADGKVDVDAIESRTPAARFGTPADVAEAARFLLSDAASYVNGQTLVVDGGWLVNAGAARPS